jgi:membrane dipeptidase
MNDAPLPDAKSLHRSLLTLDSHIDIPWPDGPDPAGETKRCVDLPKMRRGGVGCGFFVAYIPQARRRHDTEAAVFERAVGMLHAIRAMAEHPGENAARFVVTADDIERARADGVLAIAAAVENGFAVGDDLGRLRPLRDLGARYLTLTHNGHNALADSAIARSDLGDAPAEHGGLSGLGRDAIAELNRLGMLVDVSHVAKSAMLQAAEISRTPIVASHSCIRALCDHPRNLDDEQLDVLRDVGGVVQITAVSGFLRAQAKPEAVTPADFADHVDYAVRRIGIEHVGISSDFDGGGGFAGWRNAGESASITAELAGRGYDRDALALLWSGNFLRLLRRAEALAA